MKIVEVSRVDDCLESGLAMRYSFDSVLKEEDLKRLREFGNLDYYPDFPRPFFRVRNKNGLTIKGVIDENSCLVIFPPKRIDEL
ncbi:MAG: hypothetical protein ACUVT8_13105, partial [Armatimonadota bacterium]